MWLAMCSVWTPREGIQDECARYRELRIVLWKTCGLEWESESKAENVIGVQKNWFKPVGTWVSGCAHCVWCSNECAYCKQLWKTVSKITMLLLLLISKSTAPKKTVQVFKTCLLLRFQVKKSRPWRDSFLVERG